MFWRVIVVCAAVFGLCENASSKRSSSTLIPRSVLLAKPDKFCVSMNHVGNKIAYLARNGNEIKLCIEDLSGKLIREFSVKSSRGIYNFIWARTGEHILIAQDENGDENNHVICLDIKTGNSKDLTPFKGAKSEVIKISKRYLNEVIVISNKNDPKWFDAYRVNIITGKIDLIFKNNEYAMLIFDHDLNLRIVSKMMPNGSYDVYLMKNGNHEFWKNIPFEDSKNTCFSNFGADSNIIYALDSIGRDKSALVSYDLKKNSSEILFENDSADVSGFNCDPNSFAPQCVGVDYLKQEIFVIDKAIENDIDYLKSQLEGKELSIVTRNNDDTIWLVSFSSSNSPSRYYLYARDVKKHRPISLRLLFSTQPKLDEYQLQEKIPAVIKSRDGFDLVCYLTKSVDFQNSTKRRMIVCVHGGPWARDENCLEKSVQLLANRGYSVLQVNYRGSTGFGKRFINAANGNMDKIRNDIIDGVNWAIKNRIADNDSIAIMGGSFGGYSTLAGLTFTPDVFCCGVDVVGPSNWVTLFEGVPQYWTPFMESWYKFAGDPKTKEGRELLQKNSPITYVNNIKKPLIIFQGEHDPRVNKKESDQIVSAMKDRGLRVVYVLYSNEGHGFLQEVNTKSYMALTEIFLAKVLGGFFEPIGKNEFDGSSHQILAGKDIID